MLQMSVDSSHRLVLFILFIAKFFIYLIGSTLVTAGIVFLTGGDLAGNGFVFWLALLITMGLITWEFKKLFNVTTSALMLYIVSTLLLLSVFVFFTGKIYDKSWDGMAYHQIGILELSEGWNPFYEQVPDRPQASKYFDYKVNLSIWVNHYGKALETFSAALMGATGNIESGKVFHLLLFISSFFYALYLLIRLKFVNKLWSIALAFAAAFNPITVNQLFSYYLDTSVGSLFLLLTIQLILLIDSEKNNETNWSVYTSLFFVMIILINIKFTGAIYVAWLGFVFVCLILYLRMSRLIRRFFSVAIPAGLTAIFIAGFNPYVTNTLHRGHPLYPIAGENSIDVIRNMIPEPLEGHDRFTKFAMSTFSRTDNPKKEKTQTIKYKIPFTFSINELKTLQSEGVRLGGFGIFWSGIFSLTLILLALILFQMRGRERLYLLVLLVAILGSVFINPASWWARFVPQLWLFPVVICAFLLAVNKKLFNRFAQVLILLLIANSAATAVTYFYSVYSSTSGANKMLSRLRKNDKPVVVYFDIFTPNAKKFEANNIQFVKVDEPKGLPCSEPEQFLKIELCAGELINQP